MRQALHIFRKDLARFGVYIGGMVLLWIALAWAKSQIRPEASRPTLFYGVDTLVPMLLPLTIWFLMVHIIQDEPLPGDRQFWITRPYNRWSLLASKVLFVLTFISLPLILSDIYILARQHLLVVESIPAVLLRQVFVSAWLIVPLFTLGTVTDTLPRCALWLILIVVAMFFEGFLLSRQTLNQMPSVAPAVPLVLFVVLSALLASAVVWQYRSRRSTRNRIVSAAGMVLLGWPLFGYALSPRELRMLAETNEPAPELALPKDKLELLGLPGADTFVLRLPMRVSHLPANTVLSADGDLSVRSANRVLWRSDMYSDLSHSLIASRDGELSFFRAQISAGVLKAIAAQPVTLVIDVSGATLHGEPLGRVPVSAADFNIFGIGHCQSSPWMLRMPEAQKQRYPDQVSFECTSVFRHDERIFYTVEENGVESDIQGEGAMSVFGGGFVGTIGLVTGLPVSASLSPIEQWTVHVALPEGLKHSQTAGVVFRKAGPYSRFNRVLTVENVRLPSGL